MVPLGKDSRQSSRYSLGNTDFLCHVTQRKLKMKQIGLFIYLSSYPFSFLFPFSDGFKVFHFLMTLALMYKVNRLLMHDSFSVHFHIYSNLFMSISFFHSPSLSLFPASLLGHFTTGPMLTSHLRPLRLSQRRKRNLQYHVK